MTHKHGYITVRHVRLFAVLAALHLPTRWLVDAGDLPCEPECTDEIGVIR